jgi:hypothetical protein
MYKQITTYIFLLCLVFIGSGCRNKNYTTTTVRYVTAGCFGSSERVLNVYGYKDSTIASLAINGKEVKRAAITEGQIPSVSAFRRELQERVAQKDSLISTTTEAVYIQSGGEKTTYQYNGHWDGFERLTFVLLHFSE